MICLYIILYVLRYSYRIRDFGPLTFGYSINIHLYCDLGSKFASSCFYDLSQLVGLHSRFAIFTPKVCNYQIYFLNQFKYPRITYICISLRSIFLKSTFTPFTNNTQNYKKVMLKCYGE